MRLRAMLGREDANAKRPARYFRGNLYLRFSPRLYLSADRRGANGRLAVNRRETLECSFLVPPFKFSLNARFESIDDSPSALHANIPTNFSILRFNKHMHHWIV